MCRLCLTLDSIKSTTYGNINMSVRLDVLFISFTNTFQEFGGGGRGKTREGGGRLQLGRMEKGEIIGQSPEAQFIVHD
jgi:hypothetical protein